MSFNFNSINNNFNQPAIQQPQKTGDGSGGNTGYFQQGEKNEEDEERDNDEFDKSIFDDKDEETFLQKNDSDLAKFIFNKFKKLFGQK